MVCFFLGGWFKKKKKNSISSFCATPEVQNKQSKSNADRINTMLVMHQRHQALGLEKAYSVCVSVSSS